MQPGADSDALVRAYKRAAFWNWFMDKVLPSVTAGVVLAALGTVGAWIYGIAKPAVVHAVPLIWRLAPPIAVLCWGLLPLLLYPQIMARLRRELKAATDQWRVSIHAAETEEVQRLTTALQQEAAQLREAVQKQLVTSSDDLKNLRHDLTRLTERLKSL